MTATDATSSTPYSEHLLERWFGGGTRLHPRQGEIHELAAQLRLAAARLVRVDAGAADAPALEAAQEHARSLVEALDALPDAVPGSTPAASTVAPNNLLFERSPVSGLANATSSPLHITFEGERTTARAVYTEQHEGPGGGVHGGIVAACFDELLGVAQIASGAAGYTATLTVHFRKVTPLFEEVVYDAWVEHRDERKITVHATSMHGDRLLAEAEGLFIAQQHLPVPSVDGTPPDSSPA